MMVTVFRSRLRPEHIKEYEQVLARMRELVKSMPGFVSAKTFTAPDGERVSIEIFESPETLAAWREHPEHREAQRLGREKFYAEFHIQVCRLEREYGMP
jgi:heme-degrading monooxygenase HmoA